MNATELAQLIHVKQSEVFERYGLVNDIKWEDLQPDVRSALIEVAEFILQQTVVPLVGTPEQPKLTLSVEDIGDSELNAIRFMLAAIQPLDPRGAGRVINFVDDRISEEMHQSGMAGMLAPGEIE